MKGEEITGRVGRMDGMGEQFPPQSEAEAVRWAVNSAMTSRADMFPVDSAHGPGWYEAECDCDEWRTSGYENVVDDALWEHMHDAHPDWWTPLKREVRP